LDISFVPTIRAILQDLEARRPVPEISARFHQTLARAIVRMAELARVGRGITTVALTGGVFLNKRLLEASLDLLQKKRFKVLRPEHYSPNDESLSLGQIAFALNRLKRTGP
jgi:hydrogenase maturation protein HypF